MLRLTSLSGAEVAVLDKEQFDAVVGAKGGTVLALKKHLAQRLGCSRFKQRIVNDNGAQLRDEEKIRPPLDLQFVLLDLCPPDEQTYAEGEWAFLNTHIIFHHVLTIVVLVPLTLVCLAKQPLYQSMVWWLLLDGACGIIAEMYKAGLPRNHPKCQLMDFVKSVLALHTRFFKFGYTFITGCGLVHSTGSSFLLLAYFVGMLAMGCFNWLAVKKALRTIRRVMKGDSAKRKRA